MKKEMGRCPYPSVEQLLEHILKWKSRVEEYLYHVPAFVKDKKMLMYVIIHLKKKGYVGCGSTHI
jgi:hypothetical protein